jgi:hypothetical protein
MATKLKSLKTDLKKETEGVWATYPGTEFKCKIARAGNPKFDEASRSLRKNARIRQAAQGQLTGRESKAAIAPAVAEHILLDWQGLSDDDGSEIPYSRAKAVELLKDPSLNDWYDWVLSTSATADLFRAELEEEIVGNSAPTSSGS